MTTSALLLAMSCERAEDVERRVVIPGIEKCNGIAFDDTDNDGDELAACRKGAEIAYRNTQNTRMVNAFSYAESFEDERRIKRENRDNFFRAINRSYSDCGTIFAEDVEEVMHCKDGVDRFAFARGERAGLVTDEDIADSGLDIDDLYDLEDRDFYDYSHDDHFGGSNFFLWWYLLSMNNHNNYSRYHYHKKDSLVFGSLKKKSKTKKSKLKQITRVPHKDRLAAKKAKFQAKKAEAKRQAEIKRKQEAARKKAEAKRKAEAKAKAKAQAAKSKSGGFGKSGSGGYGG